jgi:hypothetical protein
MRLYELRQTYQRHEIETRIENMIRNSEFEKFEIEFVRRAKVDIMRNFHIVDALYNEAVALGIIPLKNPLDGIEVDLKIAKVVNSVSKIA